MHLLERDAPLARLGEHLAVITSDGGRIVFVAGEAGVGKSSLVSAFLDCIGKDTRVLRGACDPLTTPRPLGPLVDIAAHAGGDLAQRLDESRDRHQMFQSFLATLSDRKQPTVVVIEDAHWADEATLDLLRFLGRRINTTAALLIVTYLDDEVSSTHPLRLVLGDLSTIGSIYRLPLAPLSPDAIRQLASGSGIDPDFLYRQTGGNPFFASEVLAGAAAASRGVPATVRDAVLARASRLSPAGRAVLDAASVIGSPFAIDLLVDVAGEASEAVEECLHGGMLVPAADHALAFRHELARAAVYDALSPLRRRELHARALAALRSSPATADDLPHLAHHAEAAGDAASVLEFAPAAARQAAALRAHRDAAAQYARALRFAAGLPSAEHALLQEVYAYESYLTDRQDVAIATRRAALAYWRSVADPVKTGENLRWISRHAWFLGLYEEAHRAAREAVVVLSATDARTQLAWAYSALAQVLMLDAQTAEALEWAERALRLAEELGEREVQVHTLNNLGVILGSWDAAAGRGHLERSLELALELNLEEHVARAYNNLSSLIVGTFEFEAGLRLTNEGIAYCTEHDLDSWRTFLAANRSEILLYLGDWSGAAADVMYVLGRPQIPAMTRVLGLLFLGRLRVRRGDPGAGEVLDDALAVAEPGGGMQLVGPVRAARTEAACLAGDQDWMIAEVRAAAGLPIDEAHGILRGELRYWQWRAGMLGSGVVDLPGPYALQVAGDWRAAAEAWDAIGCPYEAARARAEGDDEDALRAALATFERLGARPMAALTARRLRERGARAIPRGPRSATRGNPANLTARELEIVPLLATGWRNAEIAERLFLSPKTVDHHVGNILSKLGVRSRVDVASAAARLGIESITESPATTEP